MNTCAGDGRYLPSMIVFDLDDCLWSPEMHELYGMPSVPVSGNLNPDDEPDNNGDNSFPSSTKLARAAKLNTSSSSKLGGEDSNNDIGVVGLKIPGTSQTVHLFDGARKALREIALDPRYKEVLIAVASSSLEPTYSHACLNHIEIIPGLTMREMLSYDEIGRTGHLTSRKTTHFESLHAKSHVAYDEMLFFDDCNWGDHCADVSESFGVISQRTPNGLTFDEFHEGLEKYRNSKIEV